MSVPDSDLLISLSEVLETPVSTLLGETIDEPKPDDLKVISEKLEIINLRFAKRKGGKTKDISLGFYLIVFVDHNCFCGFARAEQPVFGMGLQ